MQMEPGTRRIARLPSRSGRRGDDTPPRVSRTGVAPPAHVPKKPIAEEPLGVAKGNTETSPRICDKRRNPAMSPDWMGKRSRTLDRLGQRKIRLLLESAQLMFDDEWERVEEIGLQIEAIVNTEEAIRRIMFD